MPIEIKECEWEQLGCTRACVLGKLRSIATERKVHMTYSELSSQTHMVYNNIHRIINELVDMGYLELIENENGKMIGVTILG